MDFEQAYEQFEPMIYALLRKLNIYKEHEDYIQIGRIAIWEACESYDEKSGNLEVYVFMKIKFAMLQHLRKQARGNQEMVYEELPELCKDFYGDDALFVQQILQLLAAKERSILQAYYLQGLTHEEIAKISGEKVETIKKRKQRAISKLQKLIKKTKNF